MSKGESGSLRSAMPGITAWVDELRAAFGRETIDKQIRRGMRGDPVFYAEENGHRIGTPTPVSKQALVLPARKAELSKG